MSNVRRELSRGAFVNVTSFAPSDWRQQLVALDRLEGLGHIEVWLEFIPSNDELQIMKDVFSGKRLIMHGPFIGVSFASEWRQLVDISVRRCLDAIAVGTALGCEVVTLHGGTYGAFSAHGERLAQTARHVEAVIVGDGPRVALENMATRGGASRESVGSLSDLEAACLAMPQMAMTLDIGHCIENGEDYRPFLERHAPRIANIHLHDGVRDGRSHKALGTGELNTAEFIRVLAETDYQGFLTLETIGAIDTAASWAVLAEYPGSGRRLAQL